MTKPHPSVAMLSLWDSVAPKAPTDRQATSPSNQSFASGSGGDPASQGSFAPAGDLQEEGTGGVGSSATLLVNRYLEEVDAEIAAIKAANTAKSVPTAPKEKTKDRAMAIARSLVSQKKVRFQQDGFDLDLTYITPKVIAMGFPSHGRESYFRNPIDEVEKFFEARHAGHFRIYNLCSERDYEGTGRFGSRYKRFPFDDHNAPSPIKLIPDMMRDCANFLEEDESNVVAIHCKAGKGRTGLMIACLLMQLDPALRSPQDALTFFGDVRTADGKGVTIPSQMRYVRYWENMMQSHGGKEPPARILHLKTLQISSLIRPGGAVEMYFVIHERNKTKVESKRLFPQGSKHYITKKNPNDTGDGYRYEFPALPTQAQCPTHQALTSALNKMTNVLTGDLKFVFYQQNKLFKDEELFHFWLNTSLCSQQEVLPKAQLDKAVKDVKKHKDYCQDLCVKVDFDVVVAPGSQATSTAGGGKGVGGKNGGSDGNPTGAKKSGLFGRLFS